MKKVKLTIMTALAMIAAYTTPLAPIALVGCSGGGCASVAEGHDPIVVRAEQVANGSFELMDAFVAYEENNRDLLRSAAPDVEKAANTVRTEGREAVEKLREATKTYKQNRTPENKANIDTLIAMVEHFKQIAFKYLTARQAPRGTSGTAPSKGTN